MQTTSSHNFHIPVMGLAFTIDSPIKVARFGINSVISIMEDNLVEKMRSYYYPKIGEVYQPIPTQENDSRAKRITDYLNLVFRIINNQVENLKNSAFEEGSEITKYFEMLPDGSGLKNIYTQMVLINDVESRIALENLLRNKIRAGSIDVNIMTKLDNNKTDIEGNVIEDGSDAVTALRGFAKSELTDSSIVLSAGMNPRLFAYMERLPEFYADSSGVFNKKIVIKVSDYRSALIQGKMLAKKGLWVSEFRIESGLNCGGHAFASAGYLLGPILEEFKTQKEELVKSLFEIYNQALIAKGKTGFAKAHPLKITVQGGIGTNKEAEFLLQYYGLDGTGWGTPFLLVPEATTVDDHTLMLLRKAEEQDVVLSNNSPLGIRFHYLNGTTSNQEKIARIISGDPGSPCTEKFLISNTEFTTEPICTASRKYQQKKIEQLRSLNLPEADYKRQLEAVLEKECLCIGLSNAAFNKYNIKPFTKMNSVNICPGPNIAYFSEIVSLKKIVDHIYGRDNILSDRPRPHMFIKELSLYVDYFMELLNNAKNQEDRKQLKHIRKFYENMLNGIAYYRDLLTQVTEEIFTFPKTMIKELDFAEKKMKEAYLLQFGEVLQNA